jgi:hypothetical protein
MGWLILGQIARLGRSNAGPQVSVTKQLPFPLGHSMLGEAVIMNVIIRYKGGRNYVE